MTYKVHLIPVTHTHTHVNTHTLYYPFTKTTNLPGNALLQNSQTHATSPDLYFYSVFFFHYSQIAYWILNIVFTLRLIEAFCFQTVSCNVFKQKTRSAIHCLQPQSVISTTTEMETMCSMRTEFISTLLSLSLLRRQKKMLA